MIKFPTKLLLVCLLLLSQTSLVSHEIQHLGSAHNELCAVYLSQDHSALNAAVNTLPIGHVVPRRAQADVVSVPIKTLFSAYASRAPPQTIFFS